MNRSTKSAVLGLLALVIALPSLAPPLAAQDSAELESDLYRAFYLESALGDLDGAAALYAEVAASSEAASDAALLARATLGRARCLAALGRHEDARQAAERALVLDPALAEARALATRLMGGPEAEAKELESRIERLVASLAGPGREAAVGDLFLVGDLAVAPLARALRSREVGQVASAAKVLVGLDSDPATDALVAAGADPSIVFSHVIVDELLADSASDRVLRGFLAFFPTANDARRESMIHRVRHQLSAMRDETTLRAFVEMAAQDARPEVRVALLDSDWPESVDETLQGVARTSLTLESARLRSLAIRFIRGLEPAECAAVVESLYPLIEDADDRVRRDVVNLLTKTDRDHNFVHGEAVGRESCLRALAGSDLRVCHEALQAIEDTNMDLDRQLVDGIVRAMRLGAASSDAYLDLGPLAMALSAGIISGEEIIDLYIEFNEPAPVASSERFRKSVSASIFQQIGHLVREDPSWSRDLAARGLSRIGVDEGRSRWIGHWLHIRPVPEVLSAAVTSDDEWLRREAYQFYLNSGSGSPGSASEKERADELRLSPPPGGFTRLKDDLLDGDGMTQLAATALRLAIQFPEPELGDALRKCHDGVSGGSRTMALSALVASVGMQAIDVLRRDLEDTSGQVVDTALSGLIELLGEQAAPDMVARARALGQTSWFLKYNESRRSLESRPGLLGAYISLLETGEIDRALLGFCRGRLAADQRVALLTRCLTSDQAALRVTAAEMAGESLVQELWEKLVPLLEDDDPDVRNAALEALGRLREHRRMRAEIALLDRAGVVSALEEATRMLSSEDPVHRRGAALALGALGDPAAVPALLSLLRDSDDMVRDAALSALERLGSPGKQK